MFDKEQHIRTSTLDIAYIDSGPADGPVAMLLHGWPDAPDCWAPVAEALNDTGYRTIVPTLRGFGNTRFLSDATPRDGSAVALAHDAVELADALGIDRFDAVGHDWGARTAYTLAALFAERIRRIVAVSVSFQPAGAFPVPPFKQSRLFWYQWFMSNDRGAEAIRQDPKGFARIQWDTWSPPGWFDETEFARAATAFDNADWVAITLNSYRRRWVDGEASDPRYAASTARLAGVGTLATPTLMIHGGDDRCVDATLTEGFEQYFTGGYRRIVLDGIGHFPQREAPEPVAAAVIDHLS